MDLVQFVLIDFSKDDSYDCLFSKLKKTMQGGDVAIDKWLQAELFDVNGDFERTITNIHHPNNRLLMNSKTKYHIKESSYFRRGDQPIHPEHGVVFKGVYTFNSTNLLPTVGLFNPTGFTILMFCEVESTTVIVFGHGYRWFAINPYGITLNNQDNSFSFTEQLKMGEWNNVYISYNNPQSPGTYTESSAVFNHPNPNPKREIFCIVNGKEHHFNLDNININVLCLTDEDYIQSETEMHFINYSCANTLTGFFSSLILFNQSCTSVKELEWLSSTFLRYHKKPTLTYQQVLRELE